MEAGFFSLLSDVVTAGVVTDGTLLLFIFALAWMGYKYVLKPLSDKVDSLASADDLNKVMEEHDNFSEYEIEELSKKLEKLLEKLDVVEELSKNHDRDIQDLKRDIEHIKQILNQFQGHLMYSGNRRSPDFGNRELK